MEAGFALLVAGFVRSKNAMSIIAKVIIDITFGGLAFFIVGFGIAYGSSNGWFAFDIGITESYLGLDLTVSNNLFCFIQLGFAIAAISFVSNVEALQSGNLILPEQELLKKLMREDLIFSRKLFQILIKKIWITTTNF